MSWFEEQARARIKAAQAQASALSREMMMALRKAQSELANELARIAEATDPSVSGMGLPQHRQRLSTEARARHSQRVEQLGYRARIDELRSQVAADSELLAKWAAAETPSVGGDAVSLMRAQGRWDAVRARLDAGVPLRTLLQSADRDTLLAVREWAPTWLDVNYAAAPSMGGPSKPAIDVAAVRQQIDDRLAEVVGGTTQEAFTSSREAQVVKAAIDPLLAHADAMLHDPTVAPFGGLGAAMASHVAELNAQAPVAELEPEPAA